MAQRVAGKMKRLTWSSVALWLWSSLQRRSSSAHCTGCCLCTVAQTRSRQTERTEEMLVSSVTCRLSADILGSSSERWRLWCVLTCLADVTGPCRLLLPRGGHQDDCEWLAVLWLDNNLEVQVLHVLAALVWFGFQITTEIQTDLSKYTVKTLKKRSNSYKISIIDLH